MKIGQKLAKWSPKTSSKLVSAGLLIAMINMRVTPVNVERSFSKTGPIRSLPAASQFDWWKLHRSYCTVFWLGDFEGTWLDEARVTMESIRSELLNWFILSIVFYLYIYLHTFTIMFSCLTFTLFTFAAFIFMSPLGDIYSFASWQNRHFGRVFRP